MPPGFNLMLNLNKTGNFMQKSAIIVLYLKKNYTQLFFVLENFGAFKKNYTQQHSCNPDMLFLGTLKIKFQIWKVSNLLLLNLGQFFNFQGCQLNFTLEKS